MTRSADPDPSEPQVTGVDPMVRCATAAVAVVGDEMAALSGEHGRAGMMVCLRLRSHELSRSALAEDQVQSRAFEAAADDVAWGRPPLQAWLQEMSDPSAASEAERLAIRAILPAPGRDITSPAQALVREIDARWARSGQDAFDAARSRSDHLAAVQALQAQAFDDPRLRATPGLRAVMRCSAGLLQDILRQGAAGAPGASSPGSVGAGLPWRRLLRWRLWRGSDRAGRDGDRAGASSG